MDKESDSRRYYRPENAGQPDLLDVIRIHYPKGISTLEDPSIHPMSVDVGRYPIFIVALGTLCLLFGIGFISQMHGIHPTDYFWLKPLPVAGLVSGILCGPTLVMQRNASAYLICTTFLTLSFTFGITQGLELKAESKPVTNYIPLTYDWDDEGFQMWSGSWQDQDIEFGINAKWKGFVPAHPNDTRYFPVTVGDFGNLVILPQPSLARPPTSSAP